MASHGYCIFIDTICEDMIPVWRDEAGKWIVYETKAEAQAEILDDFLESQRQCLAGERDFEDAMEIEEVICEVTRLPDGSVVDEWGRVFRP
jgi:hypothetical protein